MTESGIALCRRCQNSNWKNGQWQCQGLLLGEEGSQAVYQETAPGGICYLRESVMAQLTENSFTFQWWIP